MGLPVNFANSFSSAASRDRRSAPERAGAAQTPILRAAALAVLTALAAAYAVHTRQSYDEAPLPLDDRPGRSVLFLGNSRTYVNDLPRVVRQIADSAHSPVRYDVQMRAWGGATLKDHWNDRGDQDLLAKPWDQVILQTQSGTFADDASLRDFHDYGARLTQAAHAQRAHVAVLANWTYGLNYFKGDPQDLAEMARRYGERGAEETRAFGQKAGAGVIDLEGAFAEAQRLVPRVALTSDGNHPSVAGTYLAGLTIYGYLSHDDLAKVEWRPAGLDEATARQFRAIAARHAT